MCRNVNISDTAGIGVQKKDLDIFLEIVSELQASGWLFPMIRSPVPNVNIPFIHSIDFSDDPVKKPTNYKMNCNHETLYLERQNDKGKIGGKRRSTRLCS